MPSEAPAVGFPASLGHLRWVNALSYNAFPCESHCISTTVYDILQITVKSHERDDTVVVMGDFHAKIVYNWTKAGGPQEMSSTNDAGECLIHFANANNLIVTRTCFNQVENTVDLGNSAQHDRSIRSYHQSQRDSICRTAQN